MPLFNSILILQATINALLNFSFAVFFIKFVEYERSAGNRTGSENA
jgi:hypothetical protein